MELRRLKKLGKNLKRAFLADMHRMASGWAPERIPLAQFKTPPPEARLKFSLRSRQKLGWMAFMIRIGPIKS
jgi:hypothetical protein